MQGKRIYCWNSLRRSIQGPCSNNEILNPMADIDDGSCIDTILGCTDPLAWNYDAFANTYDDTCIQ